MAAQYTPLVESFPTTITVPEDGDFANDVSLTAFKRLADGEHHVLHLMQLQAAMNASPTHTSAPNDTYNAVAFHDQGGSDFRGQFLAVGVNSTPRACWAQSPDGLTWVSAGDASNAHVLRAVAAGTRLTIGNVFVAVGDNGAGAYVARSVNADDSAIASGDWSNVVLPSAPSRLRGVVYTDNSWIFVGDAAYIATKPFDLSSPGTVRAPGNFYAGDFYCVAAHGGRLIAAGTLGEIQTSDDLGATWIRRFSSPGIGTRRCILSIAKQSQPGVVLVAGDLGELQRSTDGGLTFATTVVSGSGASILSLVRVGSVVLAYTTNEIYVSFDEGATFSRSYWKTPRALAVAAVTDESPRSRLVLACPGKIFTARFVE